MALHALEVVKTHYCLPRPAAGHRPGRRDDADNIVGRAYREINEFERQLTDHGIVLVQLWFHITAHKEWKLTDEDWRNRDA